MRLFGLLLLAALLPGCASKPPVASPQQQGGGAKSDPTPNAQRPAPSFTDVTREAGIRFQHVNGASGRFYYPETFGSGCAFLDYDGDGWLDIFLLNSGPLPGFKATAPVPSCALYHNNGNGTFTDVTKQSGLNVPGYGMGVCVGDYDNDGHPDLYITTLDRSYLFHNEGVRPPTPGPSPQKQGEGATPPRPSPSQGEGATTSPPPYEGGGRGEVKPFFRDVTQQAGVRDEGHWATSAAWLDYDNDGKLDLFVCNYIRYRPDEEQVCHQGTLRVYCGPLVYTGDSCRLYRNLGNGRFKDVSQETGIAKATGKSLGVSVWDLDDDGHPDIVVANDLTPGYLFRNKGNGTFEEIGAEAGVAYGSDGTARSGMGIDVADYRNDGKCAIFISNFAREPNSFFVQWDQPFSFSDRTYETGMGEASLQALGFGLFFFDYDNDGWKDAFVTNGHIQPDVARYEPGQTFAQAPLLFHNRSDGTFAEVGKQMGGALLETSVGRGAAYGDYNNDGTPDILLSGNDGPARLLRNDAGSPRNWLKILLVGTKSNRDGLGAEVRVHTGALTQRDQRRSGSSYLSSSTPYLHFGLGDAKTVDSVEVRWPSGARDRLEAVPANQTITLVEGSHPAK